MTEEHKQESMFEILTAFEKHKEKMHKRAIEMLDAIPTKGKNETGGVNNITFKEVKYLTKEPLALAIATSKISDGGMSLESRKSLRKHNIHSPFLAEHITSSEGYKVTKKEENGNLEHYFTYLEPNTFTVADAKKLIGQILLGLNALHRKNLVHRDLKPENILVTKDGDIRIIDLDTLAEVDANGKILHKPPPVLAYGYAAPELKKALGYKGDINSINGTGHLTVDAKAGDVYSFSEVVQLIVYQLSNQDRRVFDDLIRRISDADPKNRSTVTEIMQLPMWEESEFVREDFFEKLEADAIANKAKEDLSSGSFEMTLHPEEGDAFNLMYPAIEVEEKKSEYEKTKTIPGMKDICFEFERLKRKIEYSDATINEENYTISEKFDFEKYKKQGDETGLHLKPFSLVELEAIYKNLMTLTTLIKERENFLKIESFEADKDEIEELKDLLKCIEDDLQKKLEGIAQPILLTAFSELKAKITENPKDITEINEIRKHAESCLRLASFMSDTTYADAIQTYIQDNLDSIIVSLSSELVKELELEWEKIKKGHYGDRELDRFRHKIDKYGSLIAWKKRKEDTDLSSFIAIQNELNEYLESESNKLKPVLLDECKKLKSKVEALRSKSPIELADIQEIKKNKATLLEKITHFRRISPSAILKKLTSEENTLINCIEPSLTKDVELFEKKYLSQTTTQSVKKYSSSFWKYLIAGLYILGGIAAFGTGISIFVLGNFLGFGIPGLAAGILIGGGIFSAIVSIKLAYITYKERSTTFNMKKGDVLKQLKQTDSSGWKYLIAGLYIGFGFVVLAAGIAAFFATILGIPPTACGADDCWRWGIMYFGWIVGLFYY